MINKERREEQNEKLKGMLIRNGVKPLASHAAGLFDESDILDIILKWDAVTVVIKTLRLEIVNSSSTCSNCLIIGICGLIITRTIFWKLLDWT